MEDDWIITLLMILFFLSLILFPEYLSEIFYFVVIMVSITLFLFPLLAYANIDEPEEILLLVGGVVAVFFVITQPFRITLQHVVFIFFGLLIVVPIFLFSLRFYGVNESSKLEEAGVKGATGTVIKKIDGEKKKGKVRLRGEIWWAKTKPNTVISPEKQVLVKDIDGMTLIVEHIKEKPKQAESSKKSGKTT